VTPGAVTRPTFAESSRGLLRDTVLDAVGELAAERPFAQVKMADVAEGAGVSRQTLYNTFGSRQEMAQAYVLREAGRFLEAVDAALAQHAPDARAALESALEIFLTAAATHPVIRAVAAAEEGGELLPLLTTRGGPLVDEVTTRIGAKLDEHWPGLSPADAELVADCLVRLAISHAALPGGPPAETAAKLARILGPYVDEIAARAAAAP
jgi:AcrR family transcriptional regulator